ncbi:MAG TPA: adenylate/guanylate cyclase domain-containing protein [Candidatus Limnocylindria bacterium]|nr:adenylate/guanylate cyclase domain-containing protein [Candidatus Limnocylindria bacterium]
MATEQRKLVSVVFADVVGSTAFGSENDPEAVRSVMGSYFERMKGIAETYGGTVEKFIGDAVMVVFGVPLLHDDDAERAVRAALAMRDAMSDLNAELGVSLAARVGVNSGEAVAGSPADRQFLVTGDAVNIAARLQQGADMNEVVVGPLTESLTRSAIDYTAREPVVAKGKADPIKAFRALRPRSAVPEQARGLPAMRAQLVGRQRELRMLLESFARVRDDRRAHLFTLVGNAGIGKSRLVGEALARIAGSDSAHVLRGRCLPYGAGITYWPLMEIVREDAGVTGEDDRERALAKLESRTRDLLGAQAGAVRARLATMLGLQRPEEALPEVVPAQFGREIGWGARQYLAAVARTPAVIVVDDLQWAEPAVFEIVEGLADSAEDAPLLLLCVARLQLLELRPTWGAGRANATTITLDALSTDETTTLISRLLDIDDLPAELRARIVRRSEGNPLFCEEFLRMLIDDGRVVRADDRWRAAASVTEVRVPESIHALLAARLDGLGEDERRAMQVASIVGERFGASEIGALAPDLDVGAALAVLRRAGLVLEDRESREPDRYRFKHLLMRDVAYAGLPKAVRADLHERFAAELERAVGDRRDEFAEVLGHHAERAFSLSAEVRAHRDVLGPRATRALGWALALGDRARRREDRGLLAANVSVASAALAVLGADGTPNDHARVALLVADDRRLAGAYLPAEEAFERALELAQAADRSDLAAWSHLGTAQVMALSADFDDAMMERFERHATDAARLFDESGEPGAALEAGLIALERHWAFGQLGEMLERGRVLRERARELGDGPRELLICARLIGAADQSGRSELAREYERAAEELAARLGLRMPQWGRVARCGRFRVSGDFTAAEACQRSLYAEGVAERNPFLQIGSLRNLGEVLLEAGRPGEAGPVLEQALAESLRTGELWTRTEVTASLGQVAAESGDDARARELISEAKAIERDTDRYAVGYVAFSAARIHERAGRAVEAEAEYRRAIAVFAETEYVFALARTRISFAELLLQIGRAADAKREFDLAEPGIGHQVAEGGRLLAALREALALPRAAG